MRAESAGLLLRAVQLVAWAGFLFLWIRLSLKDWKEQKILHRDLRAATFFLAAAYVLLACSTAAGAYGWTSIYYRWDFYRDLSVHLALSFAAALGLWAGRIWPAGDAKLFMFLSALLPLLSISGSFRGGGLFFVALVNVFLPACAFVFLQVVRYLWATRFQHSAGHLRALGARRAVDFLAERVGPALRSALEAAKEDMKVLARPRELAEAAASWATAFALMAALSVILKDWVASSSVRTLLSFVLIIGWSRVGGSWGWKATAGTFAAVGVLYFLKDDPWRSAFVDSLKHMSVFGLFMMLGMKWTLGAAAGQALMFVLPPLLAALSALVPILLNAMGILPDAARTLSSAPWLREFLPLAAMGLFFGLCYVLVRVWEDEDRPEIPVDKVLSYMVLHPSFLDKLEREAPDFYEEHFASNYADGLTGDQAEALRKLCRKKKWPVVWLQVTMSFAHWIFLGYFLTWLLGGHLLERWL